MSDWKDQIAVMHLVKQELMKRDKDRLWPHHLPEVGATEEQMQEAEKALGFPLDPQYYEFLMHADGWKGFLQTVDLLGTRELMGSPLMDEALALLGAIEPDVLDDSGFSREQLLPIAAGTHDRDLFVIALPDSPAPDTVIWFAGEEIERFESFEEYFLAMVDYNREEVEALSAGG
ncbi:SMI1 / KNR4 family (SUKH-1) [Bhargavaea ginsengi]|uniref:SMI1 / KNR4 family (SUKH-1) n=1 Tax=Bhargavaea ginsengi TaxID=426757 RepID=A0A1H6UP52_9BACL|nr:SMI1/KNR4 family protein [Bhargavaea ginsengi]SEI94068.1 SMI1 / KNR4 family (SUKH-1) [Bhargavaea ginsengi]